MSGTDRPLRRKPTLPRPVLHDCCTCEHWKRRMLDPYWGRCRRLDMDTFARGAGCAKSYKERETRP